MEQHQIQGFQWAMRFARAQNLARVFFNFNVHLANKLVFIIKQ